MTEVYDRLFEIQQKLKAPKGQTNSFGGYKYRSCEDILEAVKPLLQEATITISDTIEYIGTRHYVKATVSLNHAGDSISVTAYAREAETKKGMDESQITGAASSYARKYALNGLLLIDDTKDADATNKGQDIPPAKTVELPPKDKPVTKDQMSTLYQLGEDNSLTVTEVNNLATWYRKGKKMTHDEANELIENFDQALDEFIGEVA